MHATLGQQVPVDFRRTFLLDFLSACLPSIQFIWKSGPIGRFKGKIPR